MALEPLTLFGPWQYTGFPALSTHFLSGLGPESLDGEGSPTASAQSMAARGTSCRKRKVESGQNRRVLSGRLQLLPSLLLSLLELPVQHAVLLPRMEE